MSELNKERLLLLHRGLCFYCGIGLTLETRTWDHFMPRGKGGPDLAWNLVPSCFDCNNGKADHLPNRDQRKRWVELMRPQFAWTVEKMADLFNSGREGMKLIIAGGRDYEMTAEDWEYLDSLGDVSEVVSGKCTGADRWGEKWADARGIRVKGFPADWRIGPKAGPIRNRQMAKHADAVALFPGGRGTADMHEAALEAGIIIYDLRGEWSR